MSEIDRSVIGAAGDLPISILVLFGSRASGNPRPDSNLDIAILPLASDPVSRRDIQSRVAVSLAHLSPGGRVDVVFIDEAPDLLRQRIMETGRVLICRDSALWQEWRVRTMREYGDRESTRRLLRMAQRNRLEGGDPGGRSGRALDSLERTRRVPR
jgi:predicted nucleotidyltransferase